MLVAVGGLAGCETIKENPKTSIGTGVGAAGGAVVGGLIGQGTTGVVVGGLLGGLAGGAIGYYLDGQDRTRAEAAQAIAYNRAQGDVIRVERVEATPNPVRRGGTVKSPSPSP